MRQSHFMVAFATLALCQLAATSLAAEGNTQQLLNLNAQQQKYTFLLFYRDDSQATRAMAQKLQTGLVQFAGKASIGYVSVTSPAEQAIVKQFGASRAPLPFVLAVAPNGAVTALLSQKSTDAQIASAFVTPSMAECMKAMQDRKLVFVCVNSSPRSALPTAVAEFQADPEFKDRLCVVSVQSNDAAEAALLDEFSIQPASLKGTTVVFLAPPAVLVGKFAATATKAEMAAALHAAGKCCDDPNCKHSQGNGPQATKAPSAKRK